MQALAGLGLRVLALASKKYPGDVEKGAEVSRVSVESELVFRGLIGLYDPPALNLLWLSANATKLASKSTC
jgi:Na+-exporting ATPase